MFKKELFDLIIREAKEKAETTAILDRASVGDFDLVTDSKEEISYTMLNEEAMNSVFKEITGESNYDFSALFINRELEEEVIQESDLAEGNDYNNYHYVSLDVLEIIFLNKDNSKCLILHEGYIIYNTGEIEMEMLDTSVKFSYNDSTLTISF